MKIGIIYGNSTGNTQAAAELIGDELEAAAGEGNEIVVEDVAGMNARNLAEFEVLIAGLPTWDIGELQSDWLDVFDELEGVDMKGVKVAVFGLGDAGAYSDTYQDAMGIMYEKLIECGGKGGYGFWPTEEYVFDASRAVIEGEDFFCGLALDEEGEGDKTEERVKAWVEQISRELELVKEAAEQAEG